MALSPVTSACPLRPVCDTGCHQLRWPWGRVAPDVPAPGCAPALSPPADGAALLEVTRPHAELCFGVGMTPRGTLQSVTCRVPAWAGLFWEGGDLCGAFGDAATSWWLQPGEAFLQQDLFP